MATARVLIGTGWAIIAAAVAFTVALHDTTPLVLGGLFGVIYVLAGMLCQRVLREGDDG